MIAAMITSLIYIGWRIFFTIPTQHGIVSLIAGIALVAAEAIGIIEAFNHYRNMRAASAPDKPSVSPERFPHVDVLVTTHSEAPELLYKTLNGCKHMKYPDPVKVHIYLCDDNDRPEMKALAEELCVGYLGLSGNTQAKAGNLNNALSKTDSPLAATFDADMIPMDDFLMETVPYFFLPEMIQENGVWRQRTQEELDEKYKIGFIQTPQSFYNPDMFQTNLFAEQNIPNEQDYFFREVNVGRNSTLSPIYAGSNTVLSREALDAVGGIHTGTITEDFATGLDIQMKGYACYALPQALAHGVAPRDFASLIKQRQRWGRGCVQTLRNLRFLFKRGMSFGAKMSYVSCLLYWWTFMRRFVYILSPILFTVFGVVVVQTSLWELALIWLPSYLIYNRALRVLSGNIRNQMWSNIVDTVLFPYMIIPVFVETLGFKLRAFHVTSKEALSSKNAQLKYAIPHIMLILATLLGLAYCIYDMVYHHTYGSIVLVYWLLVNGYFLLMAILFMFGRTDYRQSQRFIARIPVKIRTSSHTFTGETLDISEGGMAVELTNPEYIPYDQHFQITLADQNNTAQVNTVVTHVKQSDAGWIYSLKIIGADRENKLAYFQIVYGREHTLAKEIRSGFWKDVRSALGGRARRRLGSNRRLPRIPMNVTVSSSKGPVLMEDFNYEYLRIRRAPDQSTSPTEITLPCDLVLSCMPVANNPGLYRVENWRSIAGDERLRDFLVNPTAGETAPVFEPVAPTL